ncbi:MAG: D-tyrosyl-tRNA(Tyr) deacylase [Deltaproteobacteria bacterium]|nr:MAG: D-tyrosyl-tRNA(Tyr) deacylase [Deltaproteobacteria bacterium]
MRAVVQRVKEARVEVDKRVVGAIERGVLIFIGIADNDTEKDCEYMVNKIANLRIFPDENALMNRSLLGINGSALVVSQFTLMGDCRKGRRPSFSNAASPEKAKGLYEKFIALMKNMGIHVETGIFQEIMEVYLVNDGPVTILLDSKKLF